MELLARLIQPEPGALIRSIWRASARDHEDPGSGNRTAGDGASCAASTSIALLTVPSTINPEDPIELLDRDETCRELGRISQATLYEVSAADDPRPINVGPNTVRWVRAKVGLQNCDDEFARRIMTRLSQRNPNARSTSPAEARLKANDNQEAFGMGFKAYDPDVFDLIALHFWTDTRRMPKGTTVQLGKAPIDTKWSTMTVNSRRTRARCLEEGRNMGVRLGPSQLVIDADPRNYSDGCSNSFFQAMFHIWLER